LKEARIQTSQPIYLQRWYLSIGMFMLPAGIQTVLLPDLLAIELNQSPARDGLLKQVAGPDIQRLVSLAIGTQFASQMYGQA
jgi:hypothetical protein